MTPLLSFRPSLLISQRCICGHECQLVCLCRILEKAIASGVKVDIAVLESLLNVYVVAAQKGKIGLVDAERCACECKHAYLAFVEGPVLCGVLIGPSSGSFRLK